MVFSSMLFLWIFLPITIIGYFLSPQRFKNFFLLIASLAFYAWGEPVYILLMLTSIVINWLLGICMEILPHFKKVFLVFAIALNLGLLFYYKYFDFLLDLLNRIFRTDFPLRGIALPIGISFFTFQVLSYIIDLYRGKYEAQRNILSLALYISFFPQLIAGPIVKYCDINTQLLHRTSSVEQVAFGIRRFLYGLGKKVIIANTLAQTVDSIFALDESMMTGALAWVAALFYTMQIYYDFSGYSDMAIGLGRIFGFTFLENFNYPYLAASIQDFWRRWHISLSTWFREYLYIPLGGNRKGVARTYLNLLIVFLLTGLWHGAGMTFVLWGLYHGILSIAERLGLQNPLSQHKRIGVLYTFLAANFGWVIFRADDMAQALSVIRRMLLPWRYISSDVLWQTIIPPATIFLFFVGCLGAGSLQRLLKKTGLSEKYKGSIPELIFLAMVTLFSISMLASNSYNPFIYFRF